MFDRYPNLCADICQYAEIAPIPRFATQFFQNRADRLVYGTDGGGDLRWYRATFRILETLDEHFYEERFRYHWPLYGLGLPDEVLRKVYNGNARTLLRRA
jgi:predicted TIM-barrel fold metal-dependent hydrolase